MRVLIVEDEPIIADDLRLCLEDGGFDVVDSVESFVKAKALLTEQEVDLVLLDINIKGEMDGVVLAQYINQHHRSVTSLVER